MSTFIQVTPFDNIGDVAHSDQTIEEFATVTINVDHIVEIRKPSRRSNNSLIVNGLSYTPTIITLVTGDVIKVCESYDSTKRSACSAITGAGLNPYVQGVRTDRWGNTIAEEQG